MLGCGRELWYAYANDEYPTYAMQKSMSMTKTASAVAPANIAFIKYWGMQDAERTLPFNGSISLNLDACLTTTTVTFDRALDADEVTIALYDQPPERAAGRPLERVVAQLDRLRALAGVRTRARVATARINRGSTICTSPKPRTSEPRSAHR